MFSGVDAITAFLLRELQARKHDFTQPILHICPAIARRPKNTILLRPAFLKIKQYSYILYFQQELYRMTVEETQHGVLFLGLLCTTQRARNNSSSGDDYRQISHILHLLNSD